MRQFSIILRELHHVLQLDNITIGNLHNILQTTLGGHPLFTHPPPILMIIQMTKGNLFLRFTVDRPRIMEEIRQLHLILIKKVIKIIMTKRIWIESTNKTLHSISQPGICVELLMLTTLSLELQKKPRF